MAKLSESEKAKLKLEWEEHRDELRHLYAKIQKLENLLNPLRLRYHEAARKFSAVDRALAEDNITVVKITHGHKAPESPLEEQLLKMSKADIEKLAQMLTAMQK